MTKLEKIDKELSRPVRKPPSGRPKSGIWRNSVRKKKTA